MWYNILQTTLNEHSKRLAQSSFKTRHIDLKICTLASAEVGWREQLALWISAFTMYFGFKIKEDKVKRSLTNSYSLVNGIVIIKKCIIALQTRQQ